jgi:peptide/nickel transport system ATP-binding protein
MLKPHRALPLATGSKGRMMTDNLLLLRVENVSRHYKLPRQALFKPAPVLSAVQNLCFDLERGQTLGIVGESGSGKSTLAKMVMAFEAPDTGRILFQGQDINTLGTADLRLLRQDFQMVFQDPFGSLDPRRTVAWSIGEPMRAIGKMDAARIRTRVAEVLEQVGLHALDGQKFPHEFSGGQRQRIAIARAISTRPALLIADEAVSALDVSVQAQTLNLLMDLQAELGLSILFISHDLAVVASICDTVIVLQKGRILEAGDTGKVLGSPAHEYTRSLVAAAQM